MSLDQILRDLGEALEIAPHSLDSETRIDQVQAWDSIGWMNVIAMADSRYGVSLTPTVTKGFETAGDVARYILAMRR